MGWWFVAAWQRWMRRAKDGCGKSGCGMVDIGYGKGGFCVNFDFIFIFFFVGHLLDLDFAIGLI